MLYDPGKEPRLFVDVETGKAIWMKWPVLFEGGRRLDRIALHYLLVNDLGQFKHRVDIIN